MDILLVDDERDSREYLAQFLGALEHHVFQAGDGREALEIMEGQSFDLVMSDIKMPGLSGLKMLEELRRRPRGGDVYVVLFTGYADLHMAIEAIRAGADDFLLKPVKIEEIVRIVSAPSLSACRRGKQPRGVGISEERLVQAARLIESHPSRPGWIGIRPGGKLAGIYSPEMANVYEQARLLHSAWSYPVMIEGETGTGKELLARYVHGGDGGSERPFIDINCAAIPESMFESEIFGYEAGAFTGGAPRGQKGKLDLAQGGTLFLDEIGEISIAMQAKLLRVIEEEQYFRVGGLKKISTNARIICATNANVEEKVRRGEFRIDLYYRLNAAHLRIPPLRERTADIVPLACLFLEDMARQQGKAFAGISPEAERILLSHRWPGNVRELRNVAAWAVLNSGPEVALKSEHLRKLDPMGLLSAQAEMDARNRKGQVALPEEGFSMDAITGDIVREALLINGGNKAQTARYLGISRQTLYTWMKKPHSMDISDRGGQP